jgi:hypothetical protein
MKQQIVLLTQTPERLFPMSENLHFPMSENLHFPMVGDIPPEFESVADNKDDSEQYIFDTESTFDINDEP